MAHVIIDQMLMPEITTRHAHEDAHAGSCAQCHDADHDYACRGGAVGVPEGRVEEFLIKVNTDGHVEAARAHD